MPNSELIGFIMFLIINVIGCFLDMVLGFIGVFSQARSSSTANEMSTTARVMTILRWVLSGLLPSINFKHALFNIRLRSDPTCVSAINTIMITTFSSEEPWISLNEPGVGLQLLIFVAQTVTWWMILVCIEKRAEITRYDGCCCVRNRQKRKEKNHANAVEVAVPLDWNDSVRTIN